LLKVSYDATKIAFSNIYPVAEYYARTVKITLLLKHIYNGSVKINSRLKAIYTRL